ncbi:MAG: helix-turn-helix transcriptional regulator [Actinomycetota bacterium]
MVEVNEKAVLKKLDQLVRLMSLSLVEGKKQADQIALLSKSGFQPKEIADLLGTTPNTVRVALSNMRKKGAMKVPGKPETGQ